MGFLLLFESLHDGGVGHVYLLIAGTGGGELLSGIRRVQVSPQRRQRARDGETSKLQTHHLRARKREAEHCIHQLVCLRVVLSDSLWRCGAWAAGCSRPEWAPDHPGRGGRRKWHRHHCSRRSRLAEESSGSHPASSGPSVNPSPDLHKETVHIACPNFKSFYFFSMCHW